VTQGNYGSHALAVILLSLGFMFIVYGSGLLQFRWYHVPAWLLLPLGIYTIAFGFKNRRDTGYYVFWGNAMIVLSLGSIIYKSVNPLLALGLIVVMLTLSAIFIKKLG